MKNVKNAPAPRKDDAAKEARKVAASAPDGANTDPGSGTKAKASKSDEAKRKYEKSGYRFDLENAKAGDKVKVKVDGKLVTGELLYCKASNRHPEGKAYVKVGTGKTAHIVKRVLDHVIVPDSPAQEN